MILKADRRLTLFLICVVFYSLVYPWSCSKKSPKTYEDHIGKNPRNCLLCDMVHSLGAQTRTHSPGQRSLVILCVLVFVLHFSIVFLRVSMTFDPLASLFSIFMAGFVSYLLCTGQGVGFGLAKLIEKCQGHEMPTVWHYIRENMDDVHRLHLAVGESLTIRFHGNRQEP